MEKYRLSSYAISIELESEPDDSLLIHGYTGAIDLIDKSIVRFLIENPYFDRAVLPCEESTKDTLEKRGYVDADFKERVWEKESRSSMTIDNIAIPHAVQKAGDSIVLSVGVFRKPMPYKEDNIQIIFLLALPEEIRDENRLVCVYDEIMSLVKNDEMIEKITQSENYIDFMKVLYKRN